MGTRGGGRSGPDRGRDRQLEVEQAHEGAARTRLLEAVVVTLTLALTLTPDLTLT